MLWTYLVTLAVLLLGLVAGGASLGFSLLLLGEVLALAVMSLASALLILWLLLRLHVWRQRCRARPTDCAKRRRTPSL